MPVLRINAIGPKPRPADATGGLACTLDPYLAQLQPGAPVVVMIHGYRFSPAKPGRSPHDHIFSLDPDTRLRKAPSWPRNLGFGEAGASGLAIAFGWEACGTVWSAHARAGQTGRALAVLIGAIRARRPDTPVNIVAHSMGARVALQALHGLKAGDVGRIILLAGAELRPNAEATMDTACGRAAEVINITSRENDLFDFILETCIGLGFWRALGHGLRQRRANWVDLEIDNPHSLAALADLGHQIAPARARICHWSPYLRGGLFGLYRALIWDRPGLPLAVLARARPPRARRRWSRLLAPPVGPMPLPFRRNPSS